MPISCAGLADIALSLPVKTLTLPAIETAEGANPAYDISEYYHPGPTKRRAYMRNDHLLPLHDRLMVSIDLSNISFS